LLLGEVKSNPDEWGKAFEQLERSEYILSVLLQILGLKEKNISIRKIFGAPLKQEENEPSVQTAKSSNHHLELNAKKSNVIIFDINKDYSDEQMAELFLELGAPGLIVKKTFYGSKLHIFVIS
jgi:hypothetical protein